LAFKAVHARHHHVEQDNVALAALADLQRVRPVGGGDDVEIFCCQPRFQQLEIGQEIVNHQYAGRHGPVLSLRFVKRRGQLSPI
jgi:hypothetical protein